MPTVTFRSSSPSLAVEIAPGTTILEAAKKAGARVGDACGGNCACSTCHVWIREGYDSLSEIDEEEDDRLDMAFDVREESRLACQAEVGDSNVVVEITEESLKAWMDEHPGERSKAG